MKNLYIDCDGVIFDTITHSFREMKEKNIDLTDGNAITQYYVDVDWYDLIKRSGQINDSINKIKLLIESQEFETVQVATHRCSYKEGVIKTDIFKKLIPDLKIVTIPRKIEKHYALNAIDQILIDDDMTRIIKWVDDGGIGILFSQDVDRLIYPYENNNPYYITNDLLDALIVNNLSKEKVYKK